jgi:hypothetical protein
LSGDSCPETQKDNKISCESSATNSFHALAGDSCPENQTSSNISCVKEQDPRNSETVLSLISDGDDEDSFGEADNLLLTESSNDSDSEDLTLIGPEIDSSVKMDQPAEATVERLEYQNLTFDEAVAALTPSFQPVIPIDDLLMTGGSTESDHSNVELGYVETRRAGGRKEVKERHSKKKGTLITERRNRQ